MHTWHIHSLYESEDLLRNKKKFDDKSWQSRFFVKAIIIGHDPESTCFFTAASIVCIIVFKCRGMWNEREKRL